MLIMQTPLDTEMNGPLNREQQVFREANSIHELHSSKLHHS
jgi:hypothetical protein